MGGGNNLTNGLVQVKTWVEGGKEKTNGLVEDQPKNRGGGPT